MNEDGEDCVNFDLERMKAAINSGFITIPNGLSREDRRSFIREKLGALQDSHQQSDMMRK